MACKRLGFDTFDIQKTPGLDTSNIKKNTWASHIRPHKKLFLRMASEMCCFDLIDLNQCVLII